MPIDLLIKMSWLSCLDWGSLQVAPLLSSCCILPQNYVFAGWNSKKKFHLWYNYVEITLIWIMQIFGPRHFTKQASLCRGQQDVCSSKPFEIRSDYWKWISLIWVGNWLAQDLQLTIFLPLTYVKYLAKTWAWMHLHKTAYSTRRQRCINYFVFALQARTLFIKHGVEL